MINFNNKIKIYKNLMADAWIWFSVLKSFYTPHWVLTKFDIRLPWYNSSKLHNSTPNQKDTVNPQVFYSLKCILKFRMIIWSFHHSLTMFWMNEWMFNIGEFILKFSHFLKEVWYLFGGSHLIKKALIWPNKHLFGQTDTYSHKLEVVTVRELKKKFIIFLPHKFEIAWP